MRGLWIAGAALAGLWAVPAVAQSIEAQRFGVREGTAQMSLSPDGKRVVYLAPGPGASTIAYVADVDGGTARRLVASDGKPESLSDCNWSSNSQIVCDVYFIENEGIALLDFTRLVTVDAATGKAQVLSAPTSTRALGVAQGGGRIIDWLPGENGNVLMTRVFVPETDRGSHIVDRHEGYGVERVNTATLKRTIVEYPNLQASEYITDGFGTTRIMGVMGDKGGQMTGVTHYYYRLPGDKDWKDLSSVDMRDNGFNPYAVDRDLNVVYGFDKLDGHLALFRISLDGSLKRELVFKRDDVDVDGLIRVGPRRRVVGVSWAGDRREAEFFDPQLKALAASLSRALPGLPLIRFVDASEDETKLLLWAGSDVDAGRYYVFDRTTKHLAEIMLTRPQLENVTLSPVKPVQYAAADGTMIPAYLTLPAGSSGKGLPAIVMPHGGPGARDEWGFDWLAQFFAARGYAVLQPNFRGSTGYGDAWFVRNGFQSWRIAIGDINDGGRWLEKQGIAAPGKLGIVGWSYGGYAALQANVLDPDLFKAAVAIAPVTDLDLLKRESRNYTSNDIVMQFVGSGPHIEEGSPARNAAKIKAPVLMFHGDHDLNVNVAESRLMADRLRAAGKKVEYVEFPGLDHQLRDSEVRIGMLDKADHFLRAGMGLEDPAK